MSDQNETQKPYPNLFIKSHQKGDYYNIFGHLEWPFSTKGFKTDGDTLK